MYLRIVRDMLFFVRVITTEGSAIFLLVALFSTFIVLVIDIGCREEMSRILLLLIYRWDPLPDRVMSAIWLLWGCAGWGSNVPDVTTPDPLPVGENVRDITTAGSRGSGSNVLVITTVGLFQALRMSAILLRSAAWSMDSAAFSNRVDIVILWHLGS